jgi:hypothetical protein
LSPDQLEVSKAFDPEFNSDQSFWYTNRLFLVDNQGRMVLGRNEGAPEEQLQVEGNIKLSGNIVSDGDICIGKCD